MTSSVLQGLEQVFATFRPLRKLTFAQAGDLPVQRFGLPVRTVVAGLDPKQFWSPGSTLRVRFDTQHPLAYGMPAEGLALFVGRPRTRLRPPRQTAAGAACARSGRWRCCRSRI